MSHSEYSKAVDSALDALHSNIFVPQSIATFVHSVIDAQRSITPALPPMTQSIVSQEEFLNGKALFLTKDFPYDQERTAKLFGKLIAILSLHSTYSSFASSLKKAIEEGRFLLHEAFTAFLESNGSFFQNWNRVLNVESTILLFLVQSSIAPSVEQCAQNIKQNYSFDGWNQQYCPCCGSEPFIAYWLDSVGKQHNICSFCKTEYRVPRLQCTYCQENNPEALRYIATEEIPALHIQTCSTCKSYIKILDHKDSPQTRIPAIDDIRTLVIDIVAKQQGFTRPVLSVFGF